MATNDAYGFSRRNGERKFAAERKIAPKRKVSAGAANARRCVQIVCGILFGLAFGFYFHWDSPRQSCAVINLDITDESNVIQDQDTRPNSSSIVSPNTQRRLLFVGVMTADRFLSTRAVTVFNTWGRQIPGKIAFFSSENSTVPTECPDLPLVALPTVDDSYPPQKKSFAMLLYMWEKYGDKFEWFLRADDDVYVRPNKLENFLRSVDSNKPYFIGQAGKGAGREIGQLNLQFDQNFCMGGPGIVISRETLRRVAPFIQYCLRHMYTSHEDVELGRCVQKFARISCTWAYEMQSMLYHNSSGENAYTGSLKQKEVHQAITLHPVKQHIHMYRIHNYMRSLTVNDLQQDGINLRRDMRLMKTLLNDSSLVSSHRNIINLDDEQMTNLLGKQPSLNKFQPQKESDVFSWDMISRAIFSDRNLNPQRKMESYLKEGLDDVIREVMNGINVFSRERGRVIEFQQILYGYYRLNPLYGPDYVLDILLTYKKYRGRKMTIPVRRHTYLQRQFAGLEIREVSKPELSVTNNNNNSNNSSPEIKEEDVLINFILPLAGRYDTFVSFLRHYESTCLTAGENVALHIVLFASQEENILDDVRRLVIKLNRTYANSKILVIPVRDKFSRSLALNIGSSYVRQPNDLLFFVDVDMRWTRATLQRIRRNTELGKKAYFPIVFGEYNPAIVYKQDKSPNHFFINDDSGHWRQFGYGIASVYKRDLTKVGGFNATLYGWGKEDVEFFERLLMSDCGVSPMRSIDPGLVHVFHPVRCDPLLDPSRLAMCRNSRTDTYANVNQLANIINEKRNEILHFARKNV